MVEGLHKFASSSFNHKSDNGSDLIDNISKRRKASQDSIINDKLASSRTIRSRDNSFNRHKKGNIKEAYTVRGE